ncbi:MAG: dihydropyrimidine dehydrogenase, partial [Clostridia bacterium]|nr:dihydropyrimidine dehydrogenase [Clostridia bacterium]
MADMRKDKYPMPEQAPEERNKNFSEVALGYTDELAIQEAARCLNCKHRPCMKGCPVKVNIPDFIMQIKEGNFEEAYQIIAKTNSLPAVCGRVCPQETQCEELCIRAIKGAAVGIGRLERFAADWHMEHTPDYGEEALTGQTAIKKSIGV